MTIDKKAQTIKIYMVTSFNASIHNSQNVLGSLEAVLLSPKANFLSVIVELSIPFKEVFKPSIMCYSPPNSIR